MTDAVLYVWNKRSKVLPLPAVINPDGTGSARRDQVGRVILVGPTGAFVGHAQWFGASAWAETEHGRGRIAYRQPTGTWKWLTVQNSQGNLF